MRTLREARGEGVLALLSEQGALDVRYPPLDCHRLRLCLDGRLVGSRTAPNLATPVEYRAFVGALHFVPAGEAAHVRERGEATCLHLFLERATMRDALVIGELAPSAAERTLVAFDATLDVSIHECMVPVHRALREPDRGTRASLALFGRAVCVRLVERCARLAAPSRGGTERLSPAYLARALDALEHELVANEGLAAVAAAVGFSPHHFSRAFRNTTGLAPWKHLARRRVERAQSMLESGDEPLAAIARACGYSSQAHMTSAFRRHAGTTPGRYRAAHRCPSARGD